MTKTLNQTDHPGKISLSVNLLNKYQKAGYVFHGSENPNIQLLEPRSAKDIDKSNKFNNDKAVFASINPRASVIFACMSYDKIPENKISGEWSVGCDEIDKIIARIPLKWKKFIYKNTGYVYVLDKTSFSKQESIELGWQVKSDKAVKPIARVTVKFQDFEKLGGEIIWTSD